MATYTCTQCGHENEAERVYCHNCGTKLDRSLIPQDEDKKKKESPEKARKRVMKMVNPTRGIFSVANFRKLVETIACAALVAAVFQAVQEPDNIPPVMDNAKLIDVPQIGDRLEDEIAALQPHQLAIPEDIANAFLQKTIKSKGPDGKENTNYLKFERLFVRFEDGICKTNLKLTIFEWPLYAASYYQLRIEGGELKAKNTGGAFGRMPVHPLVMQYADALFNNVWPALRREKKLLDQLKSVSVEQDKQTKKGIFVMTTNPGKPATPKR
jgi:hypothetical protein